ncbi:MAG TPA: hypothetical protein VN683_05100 [Acidothermaceae bacterium]|nr:hypothetical protein [Acidothermaceae bacterium]
MALASCSSAAKVKLHEQTSQSSQASLGFRARPSFLPTAAPVDQVVTASPGHSQLAAQGVAVQVDMPSGQVLATITGPHVPPFVAPPPEQVTAVFDVSLKHVTGSVPVRLDDFTITDQLGRTFHPTLVRGETPPPSTLTDGRDLDLQVTAVMPIGEGRLYWAPTQSTPFVGWDFIVEND